MTEAIRSSLPCALAAAPAAAQQPGVTADKILLGQAAVFTGPAAQLGIQMRNGIKAVLRLRQREGRRARPQDRAGHRGRRLRAGGARPPPARKLIEKHKVFALLGYVGTPTGVAHLQVITAGQGAAGRHVHRRRGAARADEPLRVPRARQLLRRDREDRRAGGVDRRQEDRRVLPGRRLRRGRPHGHRDRAEEAQHEDPVQRHGGAQHRQGGEGGEGDQRLAARRGGDGRRLHRLRRVHQADEAGRQRARSSTTSPSSAARRSPTRSARTASASPSRRWCRSRGPPACRWSRNTRRLAKKAGFTDYNFSAIEGFLVAKVMVEGLRRAGKNLTREGFVDTMEKMQDVDLGGFFVSYSPKKPHRLEVRRPDDHRPRRQVPAIRRRAHGMKHRRAQATVLRPPRGRRRTTGRRRRRQAGG